MADTGYMSQAPCKSLYGSTSQTPPPMFVVKLDLHTASLTVSSAMPVSSLPSPSAGSSVTDLLPDTSETSPVENNCVASSNRPAVLSELCSVFSSELAYMAFIPFCHLAGKCSFIFS